MNKLEGPLQLLGAAFFGATIALLYVEQAPDANLRVIRLICYVLAFALLSMLGTIRIKRYLKESR